MFKVGERFECQCCQRKLTIFRCYEDEPGYLYIFDNHSGTRWIEARDAEIRFKKIRRDAHDGD